MIRRAFLKMLGVAAPVAAVAPKILDSTAGPAAKTGTDLFFPQTEVVSSRTIRVPIELRPSGRFGHFNPEGGSLGRGSGPTYETLTVNRREYDELKTGQGRSGMFSMTEQELYEFRRRQSLRSLPLP